MTLHCSNYKNRAAVRNVALVKGRRSNVVRALLQSTAQEVPQSNTEVGQRMRGTGDSHNTVAPAAAVSLGNTGMGLRRSSVSRCQDAADGVHIRDTPVAAR